MLRFLAAALVCVAVALFAGAAGVPAGRAAENPPPREPSAAILYPGFGGASASPASSPAEVEQQLSRFADEFSRSRRSFPGTAATDPLLKLFSASFDRIRKDFVVEISAKRLVDGALAGLADARGGRYASDEELLAAALNGMLVALDLHSEYMTEKAFNDMKVQSRGEFGGLGLEVSMENGLVKVVSPIDDTPAARAGLRPGDLITDIDDTPVQGLTLPEAVGKMRGPIDSKVTLRVRRPGGESFQLTLVRAKILIQAVRSHIEGGDIGYIRITSFSERADVGLNNAMRDLKQQAGNKLSGVILDLRNDPGGLLDQAVAVADAFLDKGEIITIRGRRSDDVQRYIAHPGDISSGLPLVVMINGGTASGAEIVAAALQDNHRAMVLGTRSFGKGSTQTVIPLPGHGAMRLTTALDVTPAGRLIQGLGITPDKIAEAGDAPAGATIPVAMDGPQDRQFSAAVDLIRSLVQRH